MIAFWFPTIAVLALAATTAAAQTVARDSYYSHLPSMPNIVAQTRASIRLHLYGDATIPDYRDEFPRDGIDDARGHRLLRVAARFSPILRRNNFSVPVDHRTAMGGRPVLQIDTWCSGRRIRTDSVLLYNPGTTAAWSAGTLDPQIERARSDSVLAALVHQLHPDGKDGRITLPERHEETVLFFDFPGHDEKSWRSAFTNDTSTRIYAHFFVHEDTAISGPARYSFVIQYWFFYPFNDSANNHEGDWEHLVVLVTTSASAHRTDESAGRLTENDIDRILDERNEAIVDSLVISTVEYYFHESVMTVNYLDFQRTQPLTRWQEVRHLHVWEQPHFISNSIADRITALEGRLAAHPIAYIGGNNKGPDELTNIWPRFYGSYNRNGHGTYPFSGTWQGVGPVGATEQVSGSVVPRMREGFDPSDTAASLKGAFVDNHFIAYDAEDIVLMPDWERVKQLVLDDPVARREWSWILLPIRWGFPVSASLGAGLVEHTDLGQISPEGPAFQPTWNRLAAETGFRVYEPRVLRALFVPMTPWDRLLSGWGFLNIPVAMLGFVPGWNVVLTQLGPWLTAPLEVVGAVPAKTFAPQRRPYRFTSFGIGEHNQFSGDEFARFLPPPTDTALAQHFAIPGTRADDASLRRDQAHGMRAWFNLHYGPRFAVQNAYTRSTSRLAYDAVGLNGAPAGRVEGTVKMQEITGGFRLRLSSAFGDAVQLFSGAGWGWTWYDVRNVSLSGQPIDFRKSGGYPVSILPSASCPIHGTA